MPIPPRLLLLLCPALPGPRRDGASTAGCGQGGTKATGPGLFREIGERCHSPSGDKECGEGWSDMGRGLERETDQETWLAETEQVEGTGPQLGATSTNMGPRGGGGEQLLQETGPHLIGYPRGSAHAPNHSAHALYFMFLKFILLNCS